MSGYRQPRVIISLYCSFGFLLLFDEIRLKREQPDSFLINPNQSLKKRRNAIDVVVTPALALIYSDIHTYLQ